jgi:hypothetical protein
LFTGVDFADFLIGTPYQTFYDVVAQDNDGKSVHYHFFAQDKWKVTQRLTLSYGVRYEIHPGYYDKGGDIGNFDPSVALSGRSSIPTASQSCWRRASSPAPMPAIPMASQHQLRSRQRRALHAGGDGNSQAGFPSGLEAVSAPALYAAASASLIAPSTMTRRRSAAVTASTTSTCWDRTSTRLPERCRLLLRSTPTPTTPTPTPSATSGRRSMPEPVTQAAQPTTAQDYFGTANSINWKDPYTEQWSLSVDHDFGSADTRRISYIGSETHQLVWAPDENTLPFSTRIGSFNQPLSARLFPNWGRINTRATGANESYHSLQAEGNRFQHGLQFDSSWTFAKALADNQGPGNNGSFAGESGGSRSSSVLDRHADFGNVEGTRRHLWNTTALYDLPFGRGKQFGLAQPALQVAAPPEHLLRSDALVMLA